MNFVFCLLHTSSSFPAFESTLNALFFPGLFSLLIYLSVAYLTGTLDNLLRYYLSARLSNCLGTAVIVDALHSTITGKEIEITFNDISVSDFHYLIESQEFFESNLVIIQSVILRFELFSLMPWSKLRKYKICSVQGVTLSLHQAHGILNFAFLALDLAPVPSNSEVIDGNSELKKISSSSNINANHNLNLLPPSQPILSAVESVNKRPSINTSVANALKIFAGSKIMNPHQLTQSTQAMPTEPDIKDKIKYHSSNADFNMLLDGPHDSLQSQNNIILQNPLRVLGEEFTRCFNRYLDQIGNTFRRVSRIKLVGRPRPPQAPSSHKLFKIESVIIEDVLISVGPTIWRQLLGEHLGKNFMPELKIGVWLGAKDLAGPNGRGLTSRQIGRMAQDRMVHQLCKAIVRELARGETLASLVVGSLAINSMNRTDFSPQFSPDMFRTLPSMSKSKHQPDASDRSISPEPVRRHSHCGNLEDFIGDDDDDDSLKWAEASTLRRSLFRGRLKEVWNKRAGSITPEEERGKKSSGRASLHANATISEGLKVVDRGVTGGPPLGFVDSLGVILDVVKKEILWAVLRQGSGGKGIPVLRTEEKENLCEEDQRVLRTVRNGGDAAVMDALMAQVHRVGPTATYSALAAIDLSMLLKTLQNDPRVAAIIEHWPAGLDLKYLEEQCVGYTVGRIIEMTAAGTQWLQKQAVRLRSNAERIQQDILGEHIRDPEKHIRASKNPAQLPIPRAFDGRTFATLFQVVSAVKGEGPPVRVGDGEDAWAVAQREAEKKEIRDRILALLRRGVARADAYQILTAVEAPLKFALQNLDRLPVARAHVERGGFVFDFSKVDLSEMSARPAIDVAMRGVRLPRRNSQVSTPMGPGRIVKYLPRSRCFLVALDWGSGSYAKGYFQPRVITMVCGREGVVDIEDEEGKEQEDCFCEKDDEDFSGKEFVRTTRSNSGNSGEPMIHPTHEPLSIPSSPNNRFPLLAIRLSQMEAKMEKVEWHVRQTTFPYIHTKGRATAHVSGMSVYVELGPETMEDLYRNETSKPEKPTRWTNMRVIKVKVNIREVKVVIKSSRLSSLYNYVADAFDGTVRGYVKQHVETAVRVNAGRLLNLINRKIGGHWDLVQRVFQDNPLLRNWGDPHEAKKAYEDATWQNGLVKWKLPIFSNNNVFNSQLLEALPAVDEGPRPSIMSKIKLRFNTSSDTEVEVTPRRTRHEGEYSGSEGSSVDTSGRKVQKKKSILQNLRRRAVSVDVVPIISFSDRPNFFEISSELQTS